jgi:hypothetical protein
VCLDNLSPAQNGRAFAIYAEIRKRLQRRMKAAARVKGGFVFFVSGKNLICAVARRLYLSCTAGAQGGNCFEH